MAKNITIDPIGKVVTIPGLSDLLAKLKQDWLAIKAATASVNWAIVFRFLLESLDDLINFMVQQEIPGPDKKATVLNAISQVYDWAVAPMLPFWVRPFSAQIKNILINHFCSALIDWIVSKYQNGAWLPKPPQS